MGEITLQQALDEFKTTYMPARNLATRTREEYANDLKAFIGYLGKSGITKAEELTVYLVDRYLAKLDELGYSGSTRKRKAITFRSFLSFLFRNGYIGHDISRQVILPFPEHTIPRILTKTEYQKLQLACSSNLRDYAIVTILLQTGIRLSELVRLTFSDVHIPESIDIVGKGSREGRNIPLNSKACEALQAYFSVRPVSKYANVFLNSFRKPLGDRGVQKLVADYLIRAEVKGASVKSLRHTFAAHHVTKGTSLKTIQVIMGHKDLQAVENYLNVARGLQEKEIEENKL